MNTTDNVRTDTIPARLERWNEVGRWVIYSPDDETYLMYTHPPTPGQVGCVEWVKGIQNAQVFHTFGELCVEAWQWVDPTIVRLIDELPGD